MNIETFLLILFIIFFSNVIQTITGFAGSMLAIPFLTFCMPLVDAKTLITVVGIVWSIWILFTDHQFIDLSFLRLIVSLMIVGIVIGTFLVSVIATPTLLLAMGIMIVGAALYDLRQHKTIKQTNLFYTIILSVGAGIVQGLVLMGGPILVILTNAHFTDRRYYRATLAALWLVINIVLLVIFKINNTLHNSVLLLAGICLVPLILAIWVGNKLNRKINRQWFSRLVNGMLILVGIMMLFQGLQ